MTETRKPKTTAERLKQKGVDVDFLLWLEGDDERLIKTARAARIPGRRYAEAIRAAVWLQSQFAHPERLGESTPDAWRERYDHLLGVLWNGLLLSTTAHRAERPQDLEALEAILDEVMPPQLVQMYVDDIRRLRRRGQPVRIEKLAGDFSAPRRGGKEQSEKFQRMRAAVEYLRPFTRKPYKDLADLWNEYDEKNSYVADQMRDQLKKGPQNAEQLLAFWRKVYEGDFRAVFPGPTPH